MSQPKCPSCKIRYQLPPPAPRDNYSPMLMLAKEVHWLENAARHFDDIAGDERFTAAEFIAWLKPDLNGKWAAPIPLTEGTKAKPEGAGKDSYRHRRADPLPFAPLPDRLRRIVGG